MKPNCCRFSDIEEITTQHCNNFGTTEILTDVIKERDTRCLRATLAYCLRTITNLTLSQQVGVYRYRIRVCLPLSCNIVLNTGAVRVSEHACRRQRISLHFKE